jgi:hypothetical protein
MIAHRPGGDLVQQRPYPGLLAGRQGTGADPQAVLAREDPGTAGRPAGRR